MTILFFASNSFIESRGGIERFSLQLGRRFIHDGHKVHYLSAVDDYPMPDRSDASLFSALPDPIHILSSENISYLRELITTLHVDVVFNQQADNLEVLDLCHCVSQGSKTHIVTILHFDPNHYIRIFGASLNDIMSSGFTLSRKFGLWMRNTTFYHRRQLKNFQKCYSRVFQWSDRVVLLSNHQRKDFCSFLSAESMASERIVTIPNPLTADSIDSSILKNKPKRLLFVGRLSFEAKRPDLLLQIWKRLYRDFPDWELVVVGDGDYLPIMRQLVDHQNIERIYFAGHKDAMGYYPQASILCITSNSEGFSLVATEASSQYLVPIAFDSYSAVRDIIIDAKTGFLVPPYDIDFYCQRLRQLMSDPVLLNSMAQEAHDYVQRFSMDVIAPKWYHLFNELLEP